MDSLSTMLNRLRVNDPDFKERLIKITSVYCAPFDSDTILDYLENGTLREEEKGDGLVFIPCINYNIDKGEYIFPKSVIIEKDKEIPFPESIEEFRAMCLSYGIKIKLNNKTARFLFE